MADVVELMDFWPMDDDENIGFVAADSDFQLWLISGIGVGFEDISYAVIDGPDSSGIYELIMDYEDYLNLADLYSEYLETGWAELEEEDFDEVFAAPSDENIEVKPPLVSPTKDSSNKLNKIMRPQGIVVQDTWNNWCNHCYYCRNYCYFQH